MELKEKESNTGTMKKKFTILFLLSLMTANGCIFIRTYNKAQIKERGEIRFEDLLFLESGSTKLEGILLRIGEPDYKSDNERILVYTHCFKDIWFGVSTSFFCTTLVIYLDKEKYYKEFFEISHPYASADHELIQKVLSGDEEYKKRKNVIYSESKWVQKHIEKLKRKQEKKKKP
jgi:hypothetical protein